MSFDIVGRRYDSTYIYFIRKIKRRNLRTEIVKAKMFIKIIKRDILNTN